LPIRKDSSPDETAIRKTEIACVPTWR